MNNFLRQPFMYYILNELLHAWMFLAYLCIEYGILLLQVWVFFFFFKSIKLFCYLTTSIVHEKSGEVSSFFILSCLFFTFWKRTGRFYVLKVGILFFPRICLF